MHIPGGCREGTSVNKSQTSMDVVVDELKANASLLAIHPNDAALPSFTPPIEWQWWHDPPPWQSLLDQAPHFQLDRAPIPLESSVRESPFGMSPKKYHEITRMTDYIVHLAHTRLSHFARTSIRIVDVGAGQGYLTRALHRYFSSPTLALDGDHAQTHGSRTRGSPDGIIHRTIHIIPTTLVQAIDDWIPSTLTPSDPAPVPVLLVALHACGSLTPDLFRAVFNLPPNHPWVPAAVIAVGCCYNLMRTPDDFPLASANKSIPPLPPSAFHLAAQIPAHWSDSYKALAAAKFATQKVVWRALLGRIFSQLQPDDSSIVPDKSATGSTPAMRKLGRLPDAAYTSWPAFLVAASRRIGTDFSAAAENYSQYHSLEARLENLHVGRCLLGPVVESCIILDRLAWLDEMLTAYSQRHDGGGWSGGYEAQAVNLFDQSTGSGRNIALVVVPS